MRQGSAICHNADSTHSRFLADQALARVVQRPGALTRAKPARLTIFDVSEHLIPEASDVTIVSITEAAKLAGISRGTLYNRLGEGALSRTEGGIDLAELLRVFGPLTSPRGTQKAPEGSDASDVTERPLTSPDAFQEAADVQPTRLTGADGHGDLAGLLAHRLDAADENARWLRDLLEQRERQLGERERELVTMRTEAQARLDEREAWWRSQLAATQALLPAPEASAPKRGFWRRLLG